jgi:hypothetical protein
LLAGIDGWGLGPFPKLLELYLALAGCESSFPSYGYPVAHDLDIENVGATTIYLYTSRSTQPPAPSPRRSRTPFPSISRGNKNKLNGCPCSSKRVRVGPRCPFSSRHIDATSFVAQLYFIKWLTTLPSISAIPTTNFRPLFLY